MSDDELLAAYNVAMNTPGTRATRNSLRHLIHRRLIEDFEASAPIFTAITSGSIGDAIAGIASAHGYSTDADYDGAALEFPYTFSRARVKAYLPAGEWNLEFTPPPKMPCDCEPGKCECHFVCHWVIPRDSESPQKGELLVIQHPASHAALRVSYETAMHKVPKYRYIPGPDYWEFKPQYLLGLARKRAAKSEILTRISAGVTEPFVDIQDPEIEKRIAVVETAKGLVKGLEAEPVVPKPFARHHRRAS